MLSLLLTNILKIFVQHVFFSVFQMKKLLCTLKVIQHFNVAGIITHICTVIGLH